MKFHAKSAKFFRKECKEKMNKCFFEDFFILPRLLFLLFAFFLNNIVYSQTYTNTLEDSTFSEIWIGSQTIDSGFSHSGTHYSLTDSLNPYGLGVEMFFPQERKGQNTILYIEAWAKSDKANAYSIFVLSIEDQQGTVFWKGIPLSSVLLEKDKWFRFIDSVPIPASLTAKGKIKAFLWNAGKNQKVGIDDLSISFREKQLPTYLPEVGTFDYSVKTFPEKELFSNSFYSVIYQKNKKQLMITTPNGTQILNNLFSVLEYSTKKGGGSDLSYFEFVGSKRKKGNTILKFALKTAVSKVKLEMKCNFESPTIGYSITENFTKNCDIHRSSIAFDAKQEPNEVYRFNRKSHSSNFQSEYWLDKEGIRFGKADSSLLFYHNKDISSLQFDNKNNRLLVNLDWEKDHPFLRFPLNPDSNDWKLEQSFSTYKRGDKQKYSFTAFAGSKARNLARFMKNPNGFEATYIWTEHADFSDIRTNRATYFGSERITNADSAIGGFVKYNIPVTKSVFYDNPDSITNFDASNGLFRSLECSIKPDSAFSRFLDEIYKNGSEICLHTPEQFTTNPIRFEEALFYMQNKFKSPSWIDHGYNNQPQNNREDLVCDGSLTKSEFYSLDKWNKHGLKYFWNPYYEDYFSFKEYGFHSSIEKAYTGWGDFIPKPDYWQHNSKTENIYHWPTASALFVENDGMWDYLFNTKKFKDFISNWSVEINHCYPPWVDPKKGFWTYGSDSTIVAQDGFNKTLELMSDLRDKGKLNVCTIEEFMDYRLATEEVDYEILVDGRIKITNNSGKQIQGLSFATKAKYVLVDRLKPQQKTVGNDLVFWFDIGAGKSKVIRAIE